jgi:hypothetical protein
MEKTFIYQNRMKNKTFKKERRKENKEGIGQNIRILLF